MRYKKIFLEDFEKKKKYFGDKERLDQKLN